MAPRSEGSITRGTTAPNRLRRVDRWVNHIMARRLVAEPGALVVDLGFGSSPVTTCEWARRLADRGGPSLTVIGLDIDPARVAAAADRACVPADLDVRFRHGGFELPLPDGRRPLVVRAFNVLRQYEADAVPAAWSLMAERLAPGGLLVEGTCDELGRIATWVAIPDVGAGSPGRPRTLTLSVDLRWIGRPSRVAERLPKVLIHRNVPGEPIRDLLTRLDRAWDRAAPLSVFGPRQRWIDAVRQIRGEGTVVLDGPRRWRLGELTLPWEVVAPTGM